MKMTHSDWQQQKMNQEVPSDSILLRHIHTDSGSVCIFYWLKVNKTQMSIDR